MSLRFRLCWLWSDWRVSRRSQSQQRAWARFGEGGAACAWAGLAQAVATGAGGVQTQVGQCELKAVSCLKMR